jgi:putative DNA primase/helicase
MTAESVAKGLGGRKAGGGWMARCPAHDDRDPSLSIRDGDDGKVLLRCHAGCDQRRVIAALRAGGLWGENGLRRHRLMRVGQRRANDRPDRDDTKRSEVALAIWQSATPAVGTPVETYLVSRGLYLPPPSHLRFHAGLKHRSGGIWPVMVALVMRGADNAPLAIHRTFLAHGGAGKAPLDPQRMMLGPCHGGAVRLSVPGEVVMVGEGIESCLAARRWAAGLGRALDLRDAGARSARHGA